MIKIDIWYSIQNGGDGSAYPAYFLSEKEAEADQDNMSEGWGEPCYGRIETFEGSNIHKGALRDKERRRQRR